MTQISNYNWDFVSRSKRLIANNYDSLIKQDLEVTLLVNCMISLICLIESSMAEGSYVDATVITRFLGSYKFRTKISPFDWEDRGIIEGDEFLVEGSGDNSCFKEWGLKELLRKIRNSFAHQHIKPINVNGIWVGIRTWNKLPSTNKINFVLEIDNIQLKDLYNTLADIHTESVSG